MKKLLFAGAAMALLIAASCGVIQGSGTASVYSEKDYNLFMEFYPAQFWNAELTQKFLEHASGNEAVEKFLEDFEDKYDLSPGDIDAISFGMEMTKENFTGTPPEALLFAANGNFNEDNLEEFIDENMPDMDFDEEEDEGFAYFVQKDATRATFAYSMARGNAVWGMQDSVEDSLGVIAGKDEPLTANKDFQSAKALVEPGAVAYILVWDMEDMVEMAGPAMGAFGQQVGLDENFFKSLEEVEMAALSLIVTNEAKISFASKFSSEDDAEEVANSLEDLIKLLTTRPAIETFVQRMNNAVEADDLEDVLDELSVKAEKDMVVISLEIPADSPLVDFETIFEEVEESEEPAGPAVEEQQETPPAGNNPFGALGGQQAGGQQEQPDQGTDAGRNPFPSGGNEAGSDEQQIRAVFHTIVRALQSGDYELYKSVSTQEGLPAEDEFNTVSMYFSALTFSLDNLNVIGDEATGSFSMKGEYNGQDVDETQPIEFVKRDGKWLVVNE